jgi:hypothetical protein
MTDELRQQQVIQKQILAKLNTFCPKTFGSKPPSEKIISLYPKINVIKTGLEIDVS